MQEENEVLTNQTQFSVEEPYRANYAMPGAQEVSPPLKRTHKRLFLIGVALLFVFLILLILRVARRPKVVENAAFQPEATPVVTNEEQNPLVERINRVETQLEEADPLKQNLLFPPVELEIRLDPPSR